MKPSLIAMGELKKGDLARVLKTGYFENPWMETSTIERASKESEFIVKGEFVEIKAEDESQRWSVNFKQRQYVLPGGIFAERRSFSSSLIPNSWLVPLRFKPGDEVVVTKTAWYNSLLVEWVEDTKENTEKQPEFVIAGQVVKLHKYEVDGWKGRTGRVTLLIPLGHGPANKLPSGIPEDWLEEPANFYSPQDRVQIVLEDLDQNLFMSDQP
jgi:hypothetical protein